METTPVRTATVSVRNIADLATLTNAFLNLSTLAQASLDQSDPIYATIDTLRRKLIAERELVSRRLLAEIPEVNAPVDAIYSEGNVSVNFTKQIMTVPLQFFTDVMAYNQDADAGLQSLSGLVAYHEPEMEPHITAKFNNMNAFKDANLQPTLNILRRLAIADIEAKSQNKNA